MPEILVVADDLTGALDTGAQFAQHGLATLVAWQTPPQAEARVWVLDTESRGLPPAGATRRVVELAGLLAAQVRRIYKKVDSTLRGNVGAELASLLAAVGAPYAILAPAFPAQGRTTLHGRQLVHGVPLEETPFATPGVDCSSIAALLCAHIPLAVDVVGLETVRAGTAGLASLLAGVPAPGATGRDGRVIVVDAMEEQDLATLVEAAVAAGADRLLAGSAGLAAHLPAAWGLRRSAQPEARAPCQPVLLVAGTRHPCLTCQLARLQAQAPVTVVAQVLGGLLVRNEALLAEKSHALAVALGAGDAVLTTEGEPRVAGGDRLVAATLALIAGRALEQVRPGALVLTGGDVAMAVCRGLGAEAIALEGELEPGVPVGRLVGGPFDRLTVVTKAGGFGDDDVLCRIWATLHRKGTEGTG